MTSVYENLLDQIVCDDINQAVFVKRLQLCQTQRKVISQMAEKQTDNRRKGDMKEYIFGIYDDSETAETDDDNSDEDESHTRKQKHRPTPWDRL